MDETHSVTKKIKKEDDDNIEELDVSCQNLTALPPLHPGLKKLFCHGNQLAALPSLPPGLKMLDCADNQLTSLPLLPSGLKVLYCDNNQLTALPPLPSGLEKLWCMDNQLEYKGTTIEEIRKEQEEKEKRKNIWMTNLVVFRKVKQEMDFCEETKFDWLVKNIISHF